MNITPLPSPASCRRPFRDAIAANALLVAVTLLVPTGTAMANADCQGRFQTTVQPIMNTNCVACHQDAAPADGLSLQRTAAPASLIGKESRGSSLPLVTPGNPARSYLYLKILGTHLEAGGTGARMPVGRALAEADIKRISEWISECKAG
ncbi:hypothetical protein LDO26_13145 [Luteimonas sp. BDR2-5]|uniref:hypothetical protein n=1 Tax=Proluteimonas luteida TaxID=2878685 RepID=UPI001E5C1D1E|nr:hypothetical protein [Luteimonas sp. BDR2-5]MCD9029145.1 hypothetical protein [Luteimonas sp. BDR2-5]